MQYLSEGISYEQVHLCVSCVQWMFVHSCSLRKTCECKCKHLHFSWQKHSLRSCRMLKSNEMQARIFVIKEPDADAFWLRLLCVRCLCLSRKQCVQLCQKIPALFTQFCTDTLLEEFARNFTRRYISTKVQSSNYSDITFHLLLVLLLLLLLLLSSEANHDGNRLTVKSFKRCLLNWPSYHSKCISQSPHLYQFWHIAKFWSWVRFGWGGGAGMGARSDTYRLAEEWVTSL